MNNGLFPVIPEYITVHLGRPDTPARDVTVPFADYIKNVASSEIYPTWPENALRANIYAQISYALNRIYTEYYRSRGYDFDITNSTSIDQSFVYGRAIFDNISEIVDDIFDSYLRRPGAVEPLFAVYCDGVEVQCNGLSQWGSVTLAEDGLTPYEILQNYYGDDINIVTDAPIMGNTESYPGTPLRLGSVGDDVNIIQRRLNRISRNYPNIPKITASPGLFDSETDAAVRAFQRQFSLTPDGVVGRGTWYSIARIYAAVKRLTDVDSEGVPPSDVTDLFGEELSEGDRGFAVRELQYLLAFVSALNPSVRPVEIDGVFGATTRGAVRDFQQAYGLTMDGVVGRRTWGALYNTYRALRASLPAGYLAGTVPYPGSPLRVGSRGEDVRTLQTYLSLISDYYSIPAVTADGVFGTGTQAAVRAYQEEFGLPSSGVVGAQTWASIADTYRTLTDGDDRSQGQFGGTIGRER